MNNQNCYLGSISSQVRNMAINTFFVFWKDILSVEIELQTVMGKFQNFTETGSSSNFGGSRSGTGTFPSLVEASSVYKKIKIQILRNLKMTHF